MAYAVVNFEVASSSSGFNAICSRPEVADDVISGNNEKHFGTNMLRICELLASAVLQKVEMSHLCNALTMVRPFGPHFLAEEPNISNDLQHFQ